MPSARARDWSFPGGRNRVRRARRRSVVVRGRGHRSLTPLCAAERRNEYDRALREVKVVQISCPSTALARRPPSPVIRPGGARAPSPSFRTQPPFVGRRFPPLTRPAVHRTWTDPRVDPFQLFRQIFSAGVTPSDTAFRDMHADPSRDPDYMRPFSHDSMDDMLDDILASEDPFRRALPREANLMDFGAGRGRGGGGGGGGEYGWDGAERPWEAIAKDPWGRRLDGEIQQASRGRPRRMSTTLTEGEKHRYALDARHAQLQP